MEKGQHGNKETKWNKTLATEGCETYLGDLSLRSVFKR